MQKYAKRNMKRKDKKQSKMIIKQVELLQKAIDRFGKGNIEREMERINNLIAKIFENESDESP